MSRQARNLSRWTVVARLRIVAIVVGAFVVVGSWSSVRAYVQRFTSSAEHVGDAGGTEFYCPMHPAVVRTEQTPCPSCGMALSRRRSGFATGDGRMNVSRSMLAAAGVRTSHAAWRPLTRTIRAAATIAYDADGLARVSSHFDGWIREVPAGTEGDYVSRGSTVAVVVSSDIAETHQQLISKAGQLRQLEARGATAGVSRVKGEVEALETQFRLWGFQDEHIAELAGSDRAEESVEIRSRYDGVVTRRHVVPGDFVYEGTPLFDLAGTETMWTLLDVFESDLPHLAVGLEVTVRLTSSPGTELTGVVAFVPPELDPDRRTAVVRCELPNPDGRLRAGMVADAEIRVRLRSREPYRSMEYPADATVRVVYTCRHHDVVQDTPGVCTACGTMQLVREELPAGPGPDDVLAIPARAVIDTGRRQFVWVAVEDGTLARREVRVGPRDGAFVPVISGLVPGERVVSEGAFLVDAEHALDPASASTYYGAAHTSADDAR